MGIQQINATYVADEDRLLLRVTTSQEQEYRLWLTRAVVAQWLALSDQAVVNALTSEHPPAQAQAIASFKEDVLAQKENFAQAFKPASDFPLGDKPQLVTRIKVKTDGADCKLVLALSSQQTLTLHLGQDLLLRTKLLIKRVSAQATWFKVEGFESLNKSTAQDPGKDRSDAERVKLLH